MAESLREQIYDYMKWLAENWDAYSHGIKIDEVITYESATDSIIKLMLAKVDKIEKEKAGTGITSMSYAGGFNDALEMVKSLLEGK